MYTKFVRVANSQEVCAEEGEIIGIGWDFQCTIPLLFLYSSFDCYIHIKDKAQASPIPSLLQSPKYCQKSDNLKFYNFIVSEFRHYPFYASVYKTHHDLSLLKLSSLTMILTAVLSAFSSHMVSASKKPWKNKQLPQHCFETSAIKIFKISPSLNCIFVLEKCKKKSIAFGRRILVTSSCFVIQAIVSPTPKI